MGLSGIITVWISEERDSGGKKVNTDNKRKGKWKTLENILINENERIGKEMVEVEEIKESMDK